MLIYTIEQNIMLDLSKDNMKKGTEIVGIHKKSSEYTALVSRSRMYIKMPLDQPYYHL